MSHLTLTSFETAAIYAVLVIAVISLVYAYLLYRNVMAESKGTERMIQVWTAVKEGADAYLGQQLRTILPFIGLLVFALFASVWIAQPTPRPRRCSATECPHHHRLRPRHCLHPGRQPSR